MEYAIKTPLREEVIQTLKIGDVVKLPERFIQLEMQPMPDW